MSATRIHQNKIIKTIDNQCQCLKINEYATIFGIHRNTASKQYKADLACIKQKYRYKGKKITCYYFSLLYGFDAHRGTMVRN